MLNSDVRHWSTGVLIIVAFVFVGELSLVFGEYVFYRLGINRDVFMLVLWALPFIASFVATYYASSLKLVYGLSYLLLFPLIGALGHYINTKLGGTVDFTGIAGAVEIFKIYLSIGGILILIGSFLGLVLSKVRKN